MNNSSRYILWSKIVIYEKAYLITFFQKSKMVKLFKCMNTSICGGCIYFVKMRRLLFTQNRDFFIHKVIFFFDTENRLAFFNTLHITIKSIDWGLEKHYCNKLIHLRKNNYEKQQNSTSKFLYLFEITFSK